MNYRGIEIQYCPERACFEFSVAGHAFSTLQYSAVYAIIDAYLN